MGARYSIHLRVGSAEVGGLVEIVEFDEPADLAWTSVTGIDQRLRWRLRETDDARTRVTLRLAYDAPGGLLGAISEQVSKPMVASNLGADPSESQGGDRRRTRRGERRNEHPGPSGLPARQREGPDRRGRGAADAARPAAEVRPDADALGPQPRGRRDRARGPLPERDGDRRRARHAHLLRGAHAHQRAGPLAVRPRRRRGRRRGDHVPQPPRLHRGDLRGLEAGRQLALPQHRLRRAAAGRGGRARGPAGDHLRRGVRRPALRGRPGPQARRRLARLRELRRSDDRRADRRGRPRATWCRPRRRAAP